jgi:hypothetical protein
MFPWFDRPDMMALHIGRNCLPAVGTSLDSGRYQDQSRLHMLQRIYEVLVLASNSAENTALHIYRDVVGA